MRKGWGGGAWACLAAVIVMLAGVVSAADLPGVKDYPGLPRFKGSSLIGNQALAFDKFVLPTGPVGRDPTTQSWTKPPSLTLEGKVSGYVYAIPHGTTSLEVVRNYQDALKTAGFEILFACDEDEQCGDGQQLSQGTLGGSHVMQNSSIRSAQAIIYGQDTHYLAAHRLAEGRDTYVSLFVAREAAMGGDDQDTISAVLHVIEPKPMANSMVFIDAGKMASDLGTTGHIALYGITFDFDSATVKPESDPTLKEIAKLLQRDAALKIFVVGHTDMKGTYDYNISLSTRRAAAVAEALSKSYGVAPDRLRTAGVGFVAPVASNATEEGRAKNRRVELVQNVCAKGC